MQFIDRMDDFMHVMDETQQAPLAEKLETFKAKIIAPNIQCYANVMGISDDGLSQYLTQSIPPMAMLLAGKEAALDRFHRIIGAFQDKFPRFHTDFEVYLLPSLNLFKGMAVPTPEGALLLLGMDQLVALSENSYRGYITHELFHLYHYQCSPAVRDGAALALQTHKLPPLWALLWIEGIASHAVRVIYPEIAAEDVLDWRPLVEQTRPVLPYLAGVARRTLTSDLPQDIAGFFYFPRENDTNIPTGCGYYIGMLIADILAQRYPLDQLLALPDVALIAEMNLVLKEMCG